MINKKQDKQPTNQSVLKKGSVMRFTNKQEKDLIESQEIYIKLSLKEIDSIVFHLQGSIDDYKGSKYLEGIQDKLINEKRKAIK